MKRERGAVAFLQHARHVIHCHVAADPDEMKNLAAERPDGLTTIDLQLADATEPSAEQMIARTAAAFRVSRLPASGRALPRNTGRP